MPDTEYKLFIDGEWVQPEGCRLYDDLNPATGEIYAKIAWASRGDVAGAIEAAYAARDEWATKPSHERATVLRKAADLLEQDRSEIANVLQEEVGRPRHQSIVETLCAVESIRSAGEHCRMLLGETYPSPNGKLSFTVRQPVGVVGAVSSWSFPLLTSARYVAFALAAGNAVVLRPSSEAPLAGLLLGEAFQRAGLPDGALNIVTGPDDSSEEELLANPKVKLIISTPELATSNLTAGKAVQSLKRIVLEPDCSDIVIVLHDTDLDIAVNAVASGQHGVCLWGKRVIVEHSLVDEFVQRLVAEFGSLKTGDPKDPQVVIGPLTHRKQLDLLHARVIDALNRGAKLQCGGRYDGLFYYPTVLTEVTRDMRIFQEEPFGPVAAVASVRDISEAIEAANGASASRVDIITSDLQKALYASEALEARAIRINSTHLNDGQATRSDGIEVGEAHCERGKELVFALTELKYVSIHRGASLVGF